MPSCVVPNCKCSKSGRVLLRYFSVPKNKYLRDIWAEKLNCFLDPNKNERVCSVSIIVIYLNMDSRV